MDVVLETSSMAMLKSGFGFNIDRKYIYYFLELGGVKHFQLDNESFEGILRFDDHKLRIKLEGNSNLLNESGQATGVIVPITIDIEGGKVL